MRGETCAVCMQNFSTSTTLLQWVEDYLLTISSYNRGNSKLCCKMNNLVFKHPLYNLQAVLCIYHLA